MPRKLSQKCHKLSQFDIILSVMEPGIEYNVKTIYLKVKKYGLSYSNVRQILHRLHKKGKIIRVKRGYYIIKDVVTKLSQKGGRGVPFAQRVLTQNFRLQNVLFYCRGFVGKLGVPREIVYRGVRVRLDGNGCIYVSHPEGLDLFLFLNVCGFIDNILWGYKLTLDQFMVKRFEVLSDINMGFDLSRLKGLYYREWLDNIIYKVYFKRDRIRSEFVWNEKGKITFKELSKILDIKLNSGLALAELVEYMKSLTMSVKSLYDLMHYLLQNQIEMSKMFNRMISKRDGGVYV